MGMAVSNSLMAARQDVGWCGCWWPVESDLDLAGLQAVEDRSPWPAQSANPNVRGKPTRSDLPGATWINPPT